ncbi:DUF485 domain-containing protein [Streptomyces lancefieldiae]|uniref:DUF485 domain-containing protein n=1 Tax=Streptomyces lancefieldiae TaxID=3075520 RepID=A0ABU3AIF6_9ACTN|nr:DUF485 domain-containing protein [Streptomyces sp. DSM 40712]MDT0609972.1 DUF485 domain-containing protein [Streptomyces sp. DSM 40712]
MTHDPFPHRTPPSPSPPPTYVPHQSPHAPPPYSPTPYAPPYSPTPYAPRPFGRHSGHREHSDHCDMRALRTACRRQRRTATFAALGYFLLFLGLSAFSPSTLTGTVTDGLPLGLLLALLQLPVTWLAIALYEHTARRGVDPLADRIRKESEVAARREATR